MVNTLMTAGGARTANTASGGKLTPAVVGTVGAQVVGRNGERQKISFHNVGTTNIYVYPMTTATGGANNPSVAAPAGSFLVLPGAQYAFDGECQVAWGAIGAAATNFLTVMESNT
jgi:hypothetical protein